MVLFGISSIQKHLRHTSLQQLSQPGSEPPQPHAPLRAVDGGEGSPPAGQDWRKCRQVYERGHRGSAVGALGPLVGGSQLQQQLLGVVLGQSVSKHVGGAARRGGQHTVHGQGGVSGAVCVQQLLQEGPGNTITALTASS